MALRARRSVIKQLSRVLACAVVLGALLLGGTAYAADTSVNVNITGSTAPSLAVENPVPKSVKNPFFVIRARVTALTQVQIYMDGDYVTTVPLTPDETSFEYTLSLTGGTHDVTLIGIGAYGGENQTTAFSIAYTPESPSPSATTPSGKSGMVGSPLGGVIVGGSSLPSFEIPTWAKLPGVNKLYEALVFADIVNPYRPDDTPLMLLRCGLAMLGLVLIAFARPVLASYRRARYGWLGWHKRPLPNLIRHHPLRTLRIVGVLLFVAILVL